MNNVKNHAPKTSNIYFNPKCPLEIYYEKIISPNNIFLWEFDDYFIILLQNYFCTQFFVLNVAKATSAGKNFRAL